MPATGNGVSGHPPYAEGMPAPAAVPYVNGYQQSVSPSAPSAMWPPTVSGSPAGPMPPPMPTAAADIAGPLAGLASLLAGAATQTGIALQPHQVPPAHRPAGVAYGNGNGREFNGLEITAGP